MKKTKFVLYTLGVQTWLSETKSDPVVGDIITRTTQDGQQTISVEIQNVRRFEGTIILFLVELGNFSIT